MSLSTTVNRHTGLQQFLSVECASTPCIDRLWIGEDGCTYATVSIQMKVVSSETLRHHLSTLSGTVKLVDACWTRIKLDGET
jgi:hypothetical protein